MQNHSAIVFRAILYLFFVAILPALPVFAETLPTPGEIARANADAWAAIETVDMEFAIISETIVGDEAFLTTSLQNRWIASPDRERLIRVYDLGEGDSLLSDSLLDENALREHQATTDADGALFCGTISPAINPIWQSKVNLEPYLLRYPCGEIDLDTTKTLAWIVENWPTVLKGSQMQGEDMVWQLQVQCPSESPWCDGVMEIEVNASKSFLVQKVTVNGLELAGLTAEDERTTLEMQVAQFVRSEDGGHYFPSGFVSRQFAEPLGEEPAPHTIYKEIPTRLSVNDPLPEHCFDFKFEKYEIVTQYDSLSEITAVYLWGDDNRPAETFASYEELDRWQFRQDITALVTDFRNLPRIVGRDLGHLANYFLAVGHRQLLAERQRKQERLRELAPLPIDNPNGELPPAVASAELLTDETPIATSANTSQDIEATVAGEVSSP